jgi:Double zinc ribbon
VSVAPCPACGQQAREGARFCAACGTSLARECPSCGWVNSASDRFCAGGIFDATVDFATAVADPTDPSALDPRYDYGDHLHLNDTGYAAMAQAVDICRLLTLASASHKKHCGGPPLRDDRYSLALR